MKRPAILLLFVILFGLLVAAWLVFAQSNSSSSDRYVYVNPGDNPRKAILRQVEEKHLVKSVALLDFIAGHAGAWGKVRPGRFEITPRMDLLDVVRMLRNNHQAPSRLVITKLRVREDLARLIGKNFSTDSTRAMAFLGSNDSLKKVDADTATLMAYIVPNTYLFKWTASLPGVLKKLRSDRDAFWKQAGRIDRAKAQGLTPVQATTLASIVEEETNNPAEKGKIASVYINRFMKHMPLQADPTIKYALHDFTIRRIYYNYLKTPSPFNTYLNKGLPPGPICTPSNATLDAVLDAPHTDYLYFVANADFSGTHHFSSTLAEHEQYAKAWRQALDHRAIR